MRLLTAGLQVRVLLAERFDSPHHTVWWGAFLCVVGFAHRFQPSHGSGEANRPERANALCERVEGPENIVFHVEVFGSPHHKSVVGLFFVVGLARGCSAAVYGLLGGGS
jgi:hypothetical protein